MAQPLADDPLPRKPDGRETGHQVGEDLSAMSIDELSARIAQLQQEVARLEQARDAKRRSHDAANAVFRR